MLVDWLYVQRRRTPAMAFFAHPRNLADRIVPSAIIAVAVGFVLAFWGTSSCRESSTTRCHCQWWRAWSRPSATAWPPPTGARRRRRPGKTKIKAKAKRKTRSKRLLHDGTSKRPRGQGGGLA
jgi:hypothetical protein